jgi:hypothetical protein
MEPRTATSEEPLTPQIFGRVPRTAGAQRTVVTVEPADGTNTYLLTVREGRAPFVVSTVEKYYGELLSSLAVAPGGVDGLVLVETDHELPTAAFERISEIESVLPFHWATAGGTPEGVRALCAAVAESVPAEPVALRIHEHGRTGEDSGEPTPLREDCLAGLRRWGITTASDSNESAACTAGVHVVGDWVGARVEQAPPN